MANNIVLYNVVYIYMCLCVYICTKHCVLQIFNSNYCEREKEKEEEWDSRKVFCLLWLLWLWFLM